MWTSERGAYIIADAITLRGLVMSKYETIVNFAKAIDKAFIIVNVNQYSNTDEIQKIKACLNINSANLFVHIFLHQCLQCVQTKPEGVHSTNIDGG